MKQQAKLSFVLAQNGDIEFLLLLRKKTMTEHLLNAGLTCSDEYHLNRIYEHFSDSFIITLNEQPIGLLKLSKQVNKLHIRQLQVLPTFQNKGIGAQVIQAVIKKAEKLSLPITLNVLLKNPAKTFYLRQGFQVIGETSLEFMMQYN